MHGGRGVPLTGELEKANEVYALWYQTYPRDWAPRGNLTFNDARLGRYEKAISEVLISLRLNPDAGPGYVDLLQLYTFVGRGPTPRQLGAGLVQITSVRPALPASTVADSRSNGAGSREPD